jgi:predicted unusual protein kinase regulating ubiquinone biosynthesis (AarF/ABC1/UbiB family)
MADDEGERKPSFLERLRGESQKGPGRGLGRFARLVGGGAGLARRMFKAGKQGADGELTEHDIEKLEGLIKRLGDLKGLPMKFGQMVSYLDIDMPERMRGMLGLLQTQSPATPRARAEQIVQEDLGTRGATLWAGLGAEPVCIASIGQVYRGRLPEGAEVAVKVRHPAVDEAIRSDFKLASYATAMAGTLMPGMGATSRDFIEEFQARLLEECDYSLEAERQRLFGRLYAGHPVIVVPRVFDGWCGRRVLTTSWEEGRDFEPFRTSASQEERDRAGAALFDFYIGTLYRHGLFHADPHPGNYRFRQDGRLVVFDYGCVRIFEPDVAASFSALAHAVRADDRAAIGDALRGMGAEPSKDDKAYEHLRSILRGFFGPLLVPGPHRIESRIVMDMNRMAKDKLAVVRLRLPGKLFFLLRIRFGLFAVLSRLGAVNDWAALEERYVEEARRTVSATGAGG